MNIAFWIAILVVFIALLPALMARFKSKDGKNPSAGGGDSGWNGDTGSDFGGDGGGDGGGGD